MTAETSSPSLMPSNGSTLEKALDLGFGKLLERIAPPFSQLMNPQVTVPEFLPYLAMDRGVNEWDSDASETEKRLTVALSWQIQRQAGTHQALSQAVESLGFMPSISPWFEQRPRGAPFTFDVQALIGPHSSVGDHDRLICRVKAAKSERDDLTITVVHETQSGLRWAGAADQGLGLADVACAGVLPEVPLQTAVGFSSAAHFAFASGELGLTGQLPELGFQVLFSGAGVLEHYTINDYDLRTQP